MKLLFLFFVTCLVWIAPTMSSAQTYNVTSSFTTGTGTVGGTFTYNPASSTITSAAITVSSGDQQMGNGPIAGATYTIVQDSSSTIFTVLEGPAAVGVRGIQLAFNPGLASGAPRLVNQYEFNCITSDCGSKGFTRQGVANGSVTQATAVSNLSPASGSSLGGTPVTITGSGFTGATGVTFGGTPATSFTVVSATQINATAPARGAGVADVIVTTPNGVSANTAADDFTYAVPPAPVPTLSEWAMMLFGSILAGGAAMYIQRRRQFV